MIQSSQRPAQGVAAGIVGIVTLLFGATGVFTEVRDSLNSIWHVEGDLQNGVWSWIKSRFLSVGMVLAVGFLLMVSLMASALLAGSFKYFGGLLPVPEFFVHSVEFVLSLLVLTGLFAMMCAILPEAKLGWRDVKFGAASTALLFTVGKLAIGMYVGKTISASTYGAAASVILVVAWVYYSSLVFTSVRSLLGRMRRGAGRWWTAVLPPPAGNNNRPEASRGGACSPTEQNTRRLGALA